MAKAPKTKTEHETAPKGDGTRPYRIGRPGGKHVRIEEDENGKVGAVLYSHLGLDGGKAVMPLTEAEHKKLSHLNLLPVGKTEVREETTEDEGDGSGQTNGS